MPATIDILTESLRLLRVIGSNEAPDDDDARDALSALNRMMRRWEANGLALGWNDVANMQDLLPAPPEAEEAIIYNLAMRMRPLFGKTLEPDVMAMARNGRNELRRDGFVASPLTPDVNVLRWGMYNIRSDQYDR